MCVCELICNCEAAWLTESTFLWEQKGSIIRSTWFLYMCEFSSGVCQTEFSHAEFGGNNSPETLEQTLYATICKTQEHHQLDVMSSSHEKNKNIK